MNATTAIGPSPGSTLKPITAKQQAVRSRRAIHQQILTGPCRFGCCPMGKKPCMYVHAPTAAKMVPKFCLAYSCASYFMLPHRVVKSSRLHVCLRRRSSTRGRKPHAQPHGLILWPMSSNCNMTLFHSWQHILQGVHSQINVPFPLDMHALITNTRPRRDTTLAVMEKDQDGLVSPSRDTSGRLLSHGK